MNLSDFFSKNNKVAIAFSGGVDSAYLLYAAIKSGAEVRAYYVKSPFQPQFELDDAKRLAEILDFDLQVLELDILTYNEIAENPENRCYYCKRKIFTSICAAAELDGFPVVLDGSNASDSAEERPGMQALEESAVISPLRECGLTKPEIRSLSKEAGLFTWDKPAYACLATRILHGERITEDKLRKIELSENYLASLGFTDFRVRLFSGCARIQVSAEQFRMVEANREKILAELKKNYPCVFLDLEVR